MVTQVQTEEVCDECGSTNIGYDALVKRIGGELEVVGGPYDSCQCINCQNLDTHVRSVPVQSLRDCDGQDCYYNGDKDVMTSKPINSVTDTMSLEEPDKYWYCSRCIDTFKSRRNTLLKPTVVDQAIKTKLWCTGEMDRAVGMIIHDGTSCPIHESLEGYRTEIKDEAHIPVRHITLDVLYAEHYNKESN